MAWLAGVGLAEQARGELALEPLQDRLARVVLYASKSVLLTLYRVKKCLTDSLFVLSEVRGPRGGRGAHAARRARRGAAREGPAARGEPRARGAADPADPATVHGRQHGRVHSASGA